MSPRVAANVLLTLVAAIPGIAAYLSAKHYFDFEQRSFKQIAAVGAGLCGIFGTIFLQDAVLNVFELSTRSNYLEKLTLVQFGAAVLIFYWKLRKTQAARQACGGKSPKIANDA